MSNITKVQIRNKMVTDDRWLLVGMLTIYKSQTNQEQNARNTLEKNDVGFNAADGSRFSGFCTWLLRRTSETELRKKKIVRISDYFDEWAVNMIRKRMPKYARQLAVLANKGKPQRSLL